MKMSKYKAEKYVADLVSKREKLLAKCGSRENLRIFTDKELLAELLKREEFDEIVAAELAGDYWEFYAKLTFLLEKLEKKEVETDFSMRQKHSSH